MKTCSNCATDFDDDKNGVVVTQKTGHTRHLCAAICEACMEGGRLIKVVLRRGDVGGYDYEQFSVIEAMRPFPSEHAGKGLSTPIGQPKR
jgi:hypothetical protein